MGEVIRKSAAALDGLSEGETHRIIPDRPQSKPEKQPAPGV